jgi:hypothetical protein
MAFLPHSFEEPGDGQDIRLVVDTIPTLAWSAGPANPSVMLSDDVQSELIFRWREQGDLLTGIQAHP